VRIPATRLAAAALAAVALGLWPAPASGRGEDPLARLERDVSSVEAQLVAAERASLPAEEPPGVRAQRRFEEGARQYVLGDWLHASLMLTEAVDEPAWAAAADRRRALFLLADALRRHGQCGAARVRYQDFLASAGDAPERPLAVSGALDCAVREHRNADVERLLAEASRTFQSDPPPEVRYLAAKAIFQRTDLPAAERIDRALEAFAQVGGSFQLQAWYFQGVLEVEDGNLHGSLEWFESCARAPAETDREREVRDLCILAMGRVHSEMGDPDAALTWYATLPTASPRFGEAVYEMTLAHVKAKRWEDALRLSSFIPELAPDSPFAPEATVLRGHLLLRMGRYADATEAFNVVINTYAPVRDEIDAILATHEDPVRYFDQLIGRQGSAFDAASVLPPVAVRWATTNREVAVAVGLVRESEEARAELQAGAELADRLDALLKRGGGLDAFPALARPYGEAQALENAAARAEGAWVAAAAAAAERALPLDRRGGEVARAGAARAAIEARFDRLPRTPREVEERQARLRARIDQVGRSLFQLRSVLDGATSAIAGTEEFLDRHRSEIVAEGESRQEFGEELRAHRVIVDGYEAELAALRQEIAQVRDASGGVDAMLEEARLREEYLEAVDRERAAVEAAGVQVLPEDRALVERLGPTRERLAAVRTRAREVEAGLAAEASRRSAALRGRVEAERGDVAAHLAALDALMDGSRDLLGEIAVRSVGEVRAQFYRLVLKADVGIVDVAWSRKRQRLEKIQTLAVQKDAEVEQLDREYRALLKEVE
jgi:tetratricopeptide (TPR) repeat protein